MARIKSGVPTVKEIKEGESEYRYISGTGLVLYTRYSNQIYSTKMHAASTPPVMDKKLEMAIGDRIGAATEGGEFIRSDGSVDFTGNQSHGGKNITGVNDLIVTDDVTIGDALDVDGRTTLDQTTISTTDGVFAVSGANNSTITTTGSADITLTSADKLEFAITGDCDWDTTAVDWDSSRDVDITGLGDITIEALGTAANTFLIQNTNEHASAFEGVHIKTASGDVSGCFNLIKIECDDVATKGASYGIELRSENNIKIAAEDANDDTATGLLIRATGPVDIGAATDDISPHGAPSPFRTKIHGVCEVQTLWRLAADDSAHTDTHYPINCSTHSVSFDQIDTFKLLRATTYLASDTTLSLDDYLTIVTTANDDVGFGTVWKVTVLWHAGVSNANLQVWYCYSTGSNAFEYKAVENLTTTAGILTWTTGSGIRWQNKQSGTDSAQAKASALKIQGSADF